jgi:hypothetical protein
MSKLRDGDAPGHVRETAGAAFQAWMGWDGSSPEPTVEYEVGYVPREIPISRACGLVWNCTDIVPGTLFDAVQETAQDWLRTDEPVIKRRTYGACARAIAEHIKIRLAA